MTLLVGKILYLFAYWLEADKVTSEGEYMSTEMHLYWLIPQVP